MDRQTRKRMEAIQELGGSVDIEEDRIIAVRFYEAVGDVGARLLVGLTELRELWIDDGTWSDQSMQYLEDLQGLRLLSLMAPKVTNAGLASIGKLTNLDQLELPLRRLGPASLQPLTNLVKLRVLGLAQSRFKQGSLGHVRRLPALEELRLNGCKGVDDVLQDLSSLPRLKSLDLAVSDVSDKGLVHVGNLSNLATLSLAHGNRITPKGLAQLRGLQNLQGLSLIGLGLADTVIIELCRALPECDIDPTPEVISNERRQHRRQLALSRPKQPRPDLAAWVGRSHRFCKSLWALGGEIDHLDISIKPPVNPAKVERFNRSARVPLPQPLCRILTQGASSWSISYFWEPGPNRCLLLESTIEESNMSGGGTIGPLSVLEDHQRECQEYADESWLIDFPEDQQMWLRAIPFLRMENADFLALDPQSDPKDPPVIYLCHDDESRIIAPNLASFLHHWEQLGYVGPEIWMIDEFCDRSSGCLNSETAKAQAFRDVFSNPFRRVIIEPSWCNVNVMEIALAIQAGENQGRLPILADALEEAGCDDSTILDHCRQDSNHGGSCWVVEMVLSCRK